MSNRKQTEAEITALLEEEDEDDFATDDVLAELESDNDSDHFSIDAETSASDSDEDDIPLQSNDPEYYISKDGTKWQKNSFRSNVRKRNENIIADRQTFEDL